MINPVDVCEQLLFSTVRIQSTRLDGSTQTGTGFLFQFPLDEERAVPAVVTNKHVVEGGQCGTFLLHLASGSEGEGGLVPLDASFSFTLDEFEKAWIGHPDTGVDLCAMPCEQLWALAKGKGKLIYSRDLGADLLPSEAQLQELSAVEDVLMVGYPIGLWDEANNLPIFRRGITASHPAIDFDGKSMGLIDAACFPGSSGSPVLIVNRGFYATKREGTVVGQRAMLLGVLAAGPQWSAEGGIDIRDVPTVQIPVSVTRVPVNLGYYIKARELLVLGEHVRRTLGL